MLAIALASCGRTDKPPMRPSNPPAQSVQSSPARETPKRRVHEAPQREDEVEFMPDRRQPPPTLADLLQQPSAAPQRTWEPPQVDEERVAAAGLRKLSSVHLTLYTDLPSSPAVNELPKVFDLALPQWAEYFGIAEDEWRPWRMVGYLIDNKQTFIQLGLLGDHLPPFQHGYQQGPELWVYEQPTDYYRRHLVLHEGVHSFMDRFLGGAGPPWYREGMAELLSTHQWGDGELATNWIPPRAEDAPHWGRIKVLKEAYQDGKALSLDQVLAFPVSAHRDVEAYAWSWAACVFLDRHPSYQERFRSVRRFAADTSPAFNARLTEQFRGEEREINEQWQLFIGNAEYGYDIARSAIQYQPGKPLDDTGATVAIQADRGWQSTGVLLEAGKTYRLAAQGRYSLGSEPKPWWCEPGGVTIRYYQGRPLGLLVGALRDDAAAPAVTPLLNPAPIGLSRVIRPKASGTLYVQINEPPDAWADNAGELTLSIRHQP
jgi:hypothetical protein